MIKKLWARCLILLLFTALTPSTPARQSAEKAGLQNSRQDQLVLKATDKAALAEVLRLKTEVGDQVWPGFGRADIPIILYNDIYEFLVGESNPAGSWELVAGDDFLGNPYYRRAAKDPQAFAVSIGTRWAGSMGTLDWMNHKGPFKISPDFYVVGILHEVFHAYQASLVPVRFSKALAVYKFESRYPAKNKEFGAAWNNEGAALAEALKTTDDAARLSLVQKFFKIRQARREHAALNSDLVSFENELEWLEGLAKYVEIKFYELASSHAGQAAFARYRPGLHPFLQWDFIRLERQLGQQPSDLRFYLSGMAQARLLDRLSQGWQAKAMQEGIYLEELLQATVGLKAK